jgi:hypothetical protein
MAHQAQVPNAGTSHRPALTGVGNMLYLTWKGMDDDEGLYWSTFDGHRWAPQRKVPGVGTSVGPALKYHSRREYMAWKGVDDDEGIYWSTFDGREWAPQQNVPGAATSDSPALGVNERSFDLCMAWRGVSGDEAIYWSRLDENLGEWDKPQLVNELVGSSVGPAIAGGAGPSELGLHMAWKGAGDDEKLLHAFFHHEWDPPTTVQGVASSASPALIKEPKPLEPQPGEQIVVIHMAWKGAGNDEAIYRTRGELNYPPLPPVGPITKPPRFSWNPQEKIEGIGSSAGPALTISIGGGLTIPPGLYMAWKGMGDDQAIWWMPL